MEKISSNKNHPVPAVLSRHASIQSAANHLNHYVIEPIYNTFSMHDESLLISELNRRSCFIGVDDEIENNLSLTKNENERQGKFGEGDRFLLKLNREKDGDLSREDNPLGFIETETPIEIGALSDEFIYSQRQRKSMNENHLRQRRHSLYVPVIMNTFRLSPKKSNYRPVEIANPLSDDEFPVLKNNIILRAVRGEPVDRVPVWIMRQAACKVTMMPLARFDLDAAIIFSDILVVPQALGMEIQMVSGEGPVFVDPLIIPEDMQKLNKTVDVKEELSYVYDAIRLTRHTLEGRVPLIGFGGGPWTLMGYMIEGKSMSPISHKARAWLYRYAEESHDLLKLITNVLVEFLVQQVAAGAQMLQVFESHAGLLDFQQFLRFSLPYLRIIPKKVKERLREMNVAAVPMILFARGAHFATDEIISCGYDVISLDWTMKGKEIRRKVPTNVTLQGNMDPCALLAPQDELLRIVREMLNVFGVKNYIANLGHGIFPDTEIANVEAFVNEVHRASEEMIKKERLN
ncbi:hypothetical protein SNEBB_004136 [Seison nebaliae]|nr:hypothetical protein SNEBB_004136 [Seison nebaliae]